MIIDISSLYFGAKIEDSPGTPAWSTALGQSKRRAYKIDTSKLSQQEFAGLVYNSVQLEEFAVGRRSSTREYTLVSFFRKVTVNSNEVDCNGLVTAVCREGSKSHAGRLQFTYSPHYKIVSKGGSDICHNTDTFDKISMHIGATDGCWFCSEIQIIDQDRVNLVIHVVDKGHKISYRTSTERSEAWHELVEKDSFSLRLSDPGAPAYVPDGRLNRIFYGPPGTGKTYRISRDWIPRFKGGVGSEDRFVFTTFHQSMSYEDFVEGLKPVIDESTGNVSYEVEDGVFKRIALEAASKPGEEFAIFIDEINRGNVSSIFGELITLIEEDKRSGCTNEVSCVLPYSKVRFSVPNNLFIIGTMNTSDRSVEYLDAALRRRFSFQEMKPQPELIREVCGINGVVEGFDLAEVLAVVNDRVEALLDRDHTIGHAFLMGVENLQDIEEVFSNGIVPLLAEYFYSDLGKLQMILGDGFVASKSASGPVFATNGNDRSDGRNRTQYHLLMGDDLDIKYALSCLLNQDLSNDSD